jgi:DNA-binding transcriptional MocR family regulator
MQSWWSGLDRTHGPVYLAVADAIERAIDARDLRPGEKLPPQRQLAKALDVDLTTVTRGYAEARRRGLIEAVVGRGTFVRSARSSAPPLDGLAAMIDLTMNAPPQSLDPRLRDMLRDGMEAALNEADIASLMNYHIGGGSPWARAAGAEWVRPVLGSAGPDRTLVCNGAQAAITALLTLLVRPGDTILTEALTYPRFRAAAAYFGIRLAAVATDAGGMIPDALDEACRTLAPKAVYCIPTIQNPTTVTMPPARREAVAEIVLRHGITVIEDDAYGLLPARPIPAIASLAPAYTYHLSSLSKCLSPGLRMAYLVAPGGQKTAELEAAIRATTLMPQTLMTRVVSGWIHDGAAAALRHGVRREIVARQAIARELLPADSFATHPEGPHLWLSLPPRWHRAAFSVHVRGLGLALSPSDTFAVAQPPPNAVRIGLGAAESQSALRTALRSVAAALVSEAPPELTEIV